MRLKKGILISIEGIDGSGKSSLCNIMTEKLSYNGFDVLKTKEPGATRLGQMLREILQNRSFAINNKAEFLLFTADRAQHMSDVVIPALKSNKIVISDRMIDSTLAYQGYARELDIDFVQAVNRFSTENISPDIVIYLDVDYKTAIERLKMRAQNQNEQLTYFEKEKETFFKKVIKGFDIIFKNRSNVIKIDATYDLNTISSKALKAINKYLDNYKQTDSVNNI